MNPAWLVLGGACLAIPVTLLMRKLAWRTQFLCRPNPLIVTHREPVAYLGGVGLWLAAATLLAALGLFAPAAWDLGAQWKLLFAVLPLLLMGTVDDGFVFRPAAKFALQIVAAACSVAFYFSPFGIPFLLALLCVVTLVNAVNFLDVSDGFASSIMAVALAGLAIIDTENRPVLLAMSGTALGFLSFNRSPATIYLGDGGSHLLGGMAALAMSVRIGVEPQFSVALTLALLLMVGIALFELVFVTLVRLRKGIPWWKGSPDHVALRLQVAGWSRNRAAALAGAAQLALVGLGIACYRSASIAAAVNAAAIAAVALILGAWYLTRKANRLTPAGGSRSPDRLRQR